MSSEAVAQNGDSYVVLRFAVPGLIALFYSLMNRNYFLQANFRILSRLACELTLLAVVVFTAAVGILTIYHTRIDHHQQQLREQGIITGRITAGPLDFVPRQQSTAIAS